MCCPAPNSIAGYADFAESRRSRSHRCRAPKRLWWKESSINSGAGDCGLWARRRPQPNWKAARSLQSSSFRAPGSPPHDPSKPDRPRSTLFNKVLCVPSSHQGGWPRRGQGRHRSLYRRRSKRAIETLGPLLVIEEFLEGEEVSFIGISNGKEFSPSKRRKTISAWAKATQARIRAAWEPTATGAS